MPKFTPLYDKVIILPEPPEEKMGALFLSEDAKRQPPRGTVVAAGKGTKDEPTTVKVNDLVLFNPDAGRQIKINGKNYLIMREADILSIIEND